MSYYYIIINKDLLMSNYRRAHFPGGYYFFTVVTYKRRDLFNDSLARNCLREAWKTIQVKRPFETIALCLLPDHLHSVWKLPEDDFDYSIRWNSIKGLFTKTYLSSGGKDGQRNPSRLRSQEAAIWQRRFWEHQIHDEADLQSHVNYIHYNPVKHGLVDSLEDWPWSTYHRYVQKEASHIILLNDIKRSAESVLYMGE
jgi:putative transposase